MTAAELRPPLFNHLVASRPDREGNSLTTTITSVVLHAAIIAAAVVATARVRAPAPVIEDRGVIITQPPIVIPTHAKPSGGSPGGSNTVSRQTLPPELPSVVTGEI